MIYRIEKYDTTIMDWILLFSTSNIDYANRMYKECINNNPDNWFRLAINIASNYAE